MITNLEEVLVVILLIAVLILFLKTILTVLCTGFREAFYVEKLDEPAPKKKETRGRPKKVVKLVHPEDLERYYEKRGR